MTHTLLLPFLFAAVTLLTGVQSEGPVNPALLPGSSWVVFNVHWADVEYSRGVYDWSIPDGERLSVTAVPLVINVKGAPAWARDGGLECAPFRSGYHDEYADFAVRVIRRYGARAVEIWNEPDAAHSNPALQHQYGCNWSAVQYADLLSVVYPIVKRAEPAVLVLAGALADNTGFAATLASRTPRAFDVLTYHAYAYYGGDTAKIWRMAAEMQHGYPVWVTETSLLADNGGAAFEQAQAEYARNVIQAANDHGLDAVMWYTLAGNGWRNSDLVDGGRKRPAWYMWNR